MTKRASTTSIYDLPQELHGEIITKVARCDANSASESCRMLRDADRSYSDVRVVCSEDEGCRKALTAFSNARSVSLKATANPFTNPGACFGSIRFAPATLKEITVSGAAVSSLDLGTTLSRIGPKLTSLVIKDCLVDDPEGLVGAIETHCTPGVLRKCVLSGSVSEQLAIRVETAADVGAGHGSYKRPRPFLLRLRTAAGISAQDLTELLAGCPNLERLLVSVPVEGAKMVTETVGSLCGLQSLVITTGTVTAEMVNVFERAIWRGCIRLLSIEAAQLGPEDAARFARALSTMELLRAVGVPGCIGPAAIKALAASKTLTRLQVRDARKENLDAALAGPFTHVSVTGEDLGEPPATTAAPARLEKLVKVKIVGDGRRAGALALGTRGLHSFVIDVGGATLGRALESALNAEQVAALGSGSGATLTNVRFPVLPEALDATVQLIKGSPNLRTACIDLIGPESVEEGTMRWLPTMLSLLDVYREGRLMALGLAVVSGSYDGILDHAFKMSKDYLGLYGPAKLSRSLAVPRAGLPITLRVYGEKSAKK